MPFSAAGRNRLLDQLTQGTPPDLSGELVVSAHTDYPGETGASEVSGGNYDRQAITFNAASGGEADSSNQPVLTIPPSTTIEFVGLWRDVDSGTDEWLGYQALGGAAIAIVTVNTTDNEIQVENNHGLVNDDRVVFIGGTAPGGLSEGTAYFVVNLVGNIFEVSLTSGGAALALNSQPGAGCLASKIVPEAFGAEGTLTVSDFDLILANKDISS